MYGKLVIQIAVQLESRGRLVPVFTKICRREEAATEATRFRELNPGIAKLHTEVTWQAEREYL